MLLMMAEVLQLSRVAHAFPASRFWSFLAFHQTHVDWAGCSLLLVALGTFPRSLSSMRTTFTFEDTLAQIGLGYPFLFLLAFRPPKWQAISLVAILSGYWLAWALYPAPGPGFDYQPVG